MELTQAFILTLVGMGMTFAAIGLLVVGMYALTALVKDKPEAAVEEALPAPETPQPMLQKLSVEIQRAAAAAVSVALAEGGASPRYVAAAAAVATALSARTVPAGAAVDAGAWNVAVRARRLAWRERHRPHA